MNVITFLLYTLGISVAQCSDDHSIRFNSSPPFEVFGVSDSDSCAETQMRRLLGRTPAPDNGIDIKMPEDFLWCIRYLRDDIDFPDFEHICECVQANKVPGLSLEASGLGRAPLDVSDSAWKHLEALTHLRYFSIRGLHLSGTPAAAETVLPHCANLRSLTHIDLSNTSKLGMSLSSLRTLPNLQYLNLNNAGVNVNQVEDIAEISSLTVLGCSAGELGDSDVVKLLKLPKLISLDLSMTPLTGNALKQLSKSRTLSAIDLNDTLVDDDVLYALRNNSLITELRVGGMEKSRVTDIGLQHISNLPNIRVLDLSNSQITGDGLSLFCRSNRSLQELYLEGKKIGDNAMSNVATLPTLSFLDLTGTKVGDRSLQILEAAPLLRHLFLGDTGISDKALSSVAVHEDIEVLDIHGTNIGDEGLRSLHQLQRLRFLDLGDTNVTDAGLSSLLLDNRNLAFLSINGTAATNATLAIVATLPRLRQLSILGCKNITDDGLVHLNGMKNLTCLFVGIMQPANDRITARLLNDLKKQHDGVLAIE